MPFLFRSTRPITWNRISLKKKPLTLCDRPLVLPMSTLFSITCRLFMSNSTVIRSESLGLLWFTAPLLEQPHRDPFWKSMSAMVCRTTFGASLPSPIPKACSVSSHSYLSPNKSRAIRSEGLGLSCLSVSIHRDHRWRSKSATAYLSAHVACSSLSFLEVHVVLWSVIWVYTKQVILVNTTHRHWDS